MIQIIMLALVFFLGGVAVYYVDSLMLKQFKFQKGLLIVNRSLTRRIVTALVLVLILEFKLTHGKEGFQGELVSGLIEWFGLMLGFYLARPFLKVVPGKVKRLIEYAEEVESGKVDLAHDFKKTVSESGKKLKRAGMEVVTESREGNLKEEEKQNSSSSKDEKPPSTDSKPQDNRTFEEKINDFTKK